MTEKYYNYMKMKDDAMNKKLTLIVPLYGKPFHIIEPTLDQLEKNVNHNEVEVFLIYKNLPPFDYTDNLNKYKNIIVHNEKNTSLKKHGKINSALPLITGQYVQIFDPDDSIFIEGLNTFVEDLKQQSTNFDKAPDLIVTKRVTKTFFKQNIKKIREGESNFDFKNIINKEIPGVKNRLPKVIIWNATTVFKKDLLQKIYDTYGDIIFNEEKVQLDDPIRSIAALNLTKNIQEYSGGFYNYNGPSSSNFLVRNSKEQTLEEFNELKKLIMISSQKISYYKEIEYYRFLLAHFIFIYIRKQINFNGKFVAYLQVNKIMKILKKEGFTFKIIRDVKRKIFFRTSFFKTRKVNFKKVIKNENYLNEDWISKRFKSYQDAITNDFPPLLTELNENKINLVAHSGTALSILRNNKFIPWDDDMDFYVDFKEFSLNFTNIEKIANKHGYELIGFSNNKILYDWNVYKFRKDLSEVQETEEGYTFDAVSFIDLFTLHPIVHYNDYYKTMRKNTSLYVQPKMKLLFPFPNVYWFKYRPNLFQMFETRLRFLRIGFLSKKKIKKRIEDSLKIDGNWRKLRRNDKFAKRNEVIDMDSLVEEKFENFKIKLNGNWKEEIYSSYGEMADFDFKVNIPHQPKWISRKYAIYQGYLLKLNSKTNHLDRIKDLNDPRYNKELLDKIIEENQWRN